MRCRCRPTKCVGLTGWIRQRVYSLDSLPGAPSPNQDWVRIAMVRALRQWLEANQLLAIVVGVAGTLVLLSMLLVFGGYLIVTR
jgi:hypothetical protein